MPIELEPLHSANEVPTSNAADVQPTAEQTTTLLTTTTTNDGRRTTDDNERRAADDGRQQSCGSGDASKRRSVEASKRHKAPKRHKRQNVPNARKRSRSKHMQCQCDVVTSLPHSVRHAILLCVVVGVWLCVAMCGYVCGGVVGVVWRSLAVAAGQSKIPLSEPFSKQSHKEELRFSKQLQMPNVTE